MWITKKKTDKPCIFKDGFIFVSAVLAHNLIFGETEADIYMYIGIYNTTCDRHDESPRTIRHWFEQQLRNFARMLFMQLLYDDFMFFFSLTYETISVYVCFMRGPKQSVWLCLFAPKSFWQMPLERFKQAFILLYCIWRGINIQYYI